MAELIWYLEEEGNAMTGRFDDAVWQAFASVDEVLAGVDALLIAAAQQATPCDYADDGHFYDEERSVYLLPPPGSWLWQFDSSEVSAEVFAAPRPIWSGPPRIDGPFIGCGVGFDAQPAAQLDARDPWLDRARGAGFHVTTDEWGTRISRFTNMEALALAGLPLDARAAALATWVAETISVLAEDGPRGVLPKKRLTKARAALRDQMLGVRPSKSRAERRGGHGRGAGDV